jgi:hypothetical protein
MATSSHEEVIVIRHLPWLTVALLCALPATADELPTRKAGLWEIRVQIDGHSLPVNTVHQCTDATTDKQMIATFGHGMNACSQKNISSSGDSITVDSVCKISGGTATTHAIISGDFNAAYTVKVTSKQEGGRPVAHLPANGVTNITMEAKWVGPCGKGQRPGDLIMPGGIKINVKEMAVRP